MTTNTEMIERLRGFEQDHKPDGWPAIQMRDVTALLDIVEAQAKQIKDLEAQLEAVGAGGVQRLESEAAQEAQEPVATVFTMDALTPGGGVMYHATIHKPLPAGTKLYDAPQPAPKIDAGGWLRDGSLIYRLSEGRNVDEINVNMAAGSRSYQACSWRAAMILEMFNRDPKKESEA